MTLTTVANTNTFFDWLTKTNQMITLWNTLTDGNASFSGSITISNPSFFNGNASLNVTNGFIRGDGGLLSNIRLSALVSNTITVVSNTKHITVVGTGLLGTNLFLNTANLSNSTADQSTANIASANSVYQVDSKILSAYATANAAFTGANSAALAVISAYTNANSAYGQANTATTDAANARAHANSAYAQANTASGGGAAFDRANLANQTANTVTINAASAYDFANTTSTLAYLIWTRANAANLTANTNAVTVVSAYGQANTATTDAANARAHANSGYNQANLARSTANAAFTVANTGSSGPAYDRANTEFFGAYLFGPLDQFSTERILTYAPFNFTLDQVAYRVKSGAVTVKITKNGSSVTNCSALSATTATKTNNATAINSYSKGDYMEVVLTNNVSSDDTLELVFMITKSSTN
jgi:hypothetical protein